MKTNCQQNEHRLEHGRLSERRHRLRSIDKYLHEARERLWKEKNHLDNPTFNILIAIEQLYFYCRQHLDKELKAHHMPVTNSNDYPCTCVCSCNYEK